MIRSRLRATRLRAMTCVVVGGLCGVVAFGCHDVPTRPVEVDLSTLKPRYWVDTYFNFDTPKEIIHVWTDPSIACWALFDYPNMMGSMVGYGCQETWYGSPVTAQSSLMYGNNNPWEPGYIYWEWLEDDGSIGGIGTWPENPSPYTNFGLPITCNLTTVTRGQEIQCTAWPAPWVTLQGWYFVPDDPAFLATWRTQDSTSDIWQGVMVTSGTITVYGQANPPQGVWGTAKITVNPRSWSDWTVTSVQEHQDIVVSPMVQPFAQGTAAGLFTIRDIYMIFDASVTELTDGPNVGYAYFVDRPNNPVGNAYIHPALFPGSPFHDQQPGSPYCTVAKVDEFRGNVRRHEGATYSDSSHLGVAKRMFLQDHPQTLIEAVVVKGDVELLQTRGISVWDTYLLTGTYPAAQDAFDDADTPVVNNIGCNFYYFLY